MRVLELDRENQDMWLNYLAEEPQALIYYSLEFRDLLSHVTGATPRYWLAIEGSKPVGILPTFWLPGPFGYVVNALPFFGSYGSPLASSDEAMTLLMSHWDHMTTASDVGSATMIQNPLCRTPYSDHPPTDQRLAAFTDLTAASSDETTGGPLTKLHPSARRNVSHAQRSGVTVERVSPALSDYVWLYEQHRSNMERICGIPKPLSFFTYLASHPSMTKNVRFYYAVHGGQRIAAVLFLADSVTLEYITPGITDLGRDLQATSVILAQAMVDAARDRMSRLNWGGTWPTQEGVRRFKRKWSTYTKEYYYYTVVRDSRILGATPDQLQKCYRNFYVVPYGWLNV